MISRTKPITGELLRLKDEIRQYAVDYGLTFEEVIFEVCDYDTVNILAAQEGFPSRYPHWRFGMNYDQMSKGYAYGMQKIYEMVINTKPCYAYLLKANHLVDQKTVMAHVYGHADFFKNNAWFANTNRNMMDVMANHGTKIRRYMERYGQDKVEAFIDTVLSLENLMDINVLFSNSMSKSHYDAGEFDDSDDRSAALKSFMRSKERHENDKKPKVKKDEEEKYNPMKEKLPCRDIMLFLLEHAPLEEWQSDVIGILREEAYYFLPQRMTKIMNEGWASYWHSTIMCEKALKASEIIDFADHNAGVMAMGPQNINPYRVGIELFRDIEYRWNTGRFGKDYLECDDMVEKANWNKDSGLGRQKIFEIRKAYNDLSFIDDFMTPEFCERQQLFTYKYNPRSGRMEIDRKDFAAIKEKMLNQLTNFGCPMIDIIDANFGNRGELLLKHVHHGVDLDMAYAADTMRNIYTLWKRPINLTTVYEDKECVFIFDGKELRPLN